MNGTNLHVQMVHRAKKEGDTHSHETSLPHMTAHSPADENAIIDDSDSDLAWTDDVEDSEYEMKLDFPRLNHLPALALGRSLLTVQFQKIPSTVLQRHTSKSAQATCYIPLHDFNDSCVKQDQALEMQTTHSRGTSNYKAQIDFPPGSQRRMYGKEINKNMRHSLLHELGRVVFRGSQPYRIGKLGRPRKCGSATITRVITLWASTIRRDGRLFQKGELYRNYDRNEVKVKGVAAVREQAEQRM